MSTPADTDYALTTYDNPYSPFTEFELWFKYDMILGHNCCGLLDQTAAIDSIQSEQLNEKDSLDAIDYIVKQNPLIYRKVLRSDYEKSDE